MAANPRIDFLLAHSDGFTRSRLAALYADFAPLRAANPEGYAANVATWRRALAALARAALLPGAHAAAPPNVLVLTAGPALVHALASERHGRPLGLRAVVAEAARAGALVPLGAFQRATSSLYTSRGPAGGSWTAWAAALSRQALAWGVRQVVGGDGGASVAAYDENSPWPTADYVVVGNVEAAAAAFAARTAGVRSAYERTWSVAHFKREFGAPGALFDDVQLSDTDMDVLLTFLSRDTRAVAFDGHVVRLRAAGDGNDDAGPAAITDADRGAAQVRELVDALTHQTAVLSRRVDDLAAEARAAAGHPARKVAALAALRQKKQVEAVLAARFATLAQLEAVAAQLQQAADHVQLVQAMDAGAAALETLHAQVGGAEGAGAVAARLRQQMDAADEVGRILAEPAAAADGNGNDDDSVLDDELEALAREEVAKAEKTGKTGKTGGETDTDAAEATRQRLAAAGAAPQTPPGQAEADVDSDTTAERLQNLSLGT